MAKLKVAVVGTGKVAQTNYLPCLAAEPDVTLAYLSRTRSKAEACASKFGGVSVDSMRELMDWQPDTVFILTREMERYDVASALLEHGPRRIFFEKPLVAHHGQENVTEQDFVDGRTILNTARDRGCETAMVFNYRFFEHSQLARQIVQERDFGQALNITGLVHYACWSHCIDLVHFFGGPIEEVSALQSQSEHANGSMRARDMTIAFRTSGDATGTLIGTTTLAWDFPLFDLTINFERGRIRMQDLDGDMDVMDARKMEVEHYHIYGAKSRWDQYNSSFDKSIKAYLDSVGQGQPPPVPGIASLLELQVEAGAKRSIAQARPVNLTSEFPLT
jgi:predicted dehydrogenase